jgi:hypothetical protein
VIFEEASAARREFFAPTIDGFLETMFAQYGVHLGRVRGYGMYSETHREEWTGRPLPGRGSALLGNGGTSRESTEENLLRAFTAYRILDDLFGPGVPTGCTDDPKRGEQSPSDESTFYRFR